MTETATRIAHLLDAPGAAKTLVRWFEAAWGPWYGPDGPGDAAADLAACQDRDATPLCLVALGADDTVLGTASLRDESAGSDIAEGPWLAAWLVGESHRRRGVGTALAAAIEAEARRLSFPALYVSIDETTEAMLKRRGWRPIGRTQSLRGPITVYRLDLAVTIRDEQPA